MNIGIDIRAIGQQRTGDEYYTLNLVRNLLKIDKKNQYFLFTNTCDTKLIEKKILEGTRIKKSQLKIISVLPKSKFLWTFFALPKAAKKFDVDILHVQYITPFWLSRKIKLITTIADVSFKAFPEFIAKSDLFFLNLLIPLSLRRADKIVSVSHFTKDEIIKYYDVSSEKITAVHNGGARKIFSSKAKTDESILKKNGIKKPFLFYVGTHQPRKDLPNLIKGFLELKKNNSNRKEVKNLQLVIGGKLNAHNYDPRIDEVIRKAKKDETRKAFLQDLIFTGYLEDSELATIHQKAQIFVFPSLYEGYGIPLLEAMASETPVVASDIPCSKEVAGEAAQFYKAGNKNSLQKVLFKVIIDPELQRKMIKKGIENSKKYSWEKTARETLKVFLS